MGEAFDVVIVGGAVTGSAAAHFLSARGGPGLRVLVLERDPSYRDCATTRSLASIRHQFSTVENVRMSMFGTEFLRDAAQALAVDGEAPAIGFVEAGYLFLARDAGRAVLQANHATQCAAGAQVGLLEPAQLRARFPWLACDDLAAGALGLAGEGWLDAHALMHGLRRKAVRGGVQYRAAHAVALERDGRRIVGVRLADGSAVACGWVVNAAGIGAAALAASAGIGLPVQARKRCVFNVRSPAQLPGCPLVIDPGGVYFRPEGQGFVCGVAPDDVADGPCEDLEVDWALFDERVWPALAARVPGFEALRLAGGWAGHYDVNLLDQNMILGAHPEVDNLLFANGFSGHGLQHAPAVGRALAELVLDGGFRTLDLSALGWERVLAGRPLREHNVV